MAQVTAHAGTAGTKDRGRAVAAVAAQHGGLFRFRIG